MPALDPVLGLALRLSRSQTDADDVVQETYLRAWAAWCTGTRPRNPRAWLATMCLNVVRDGWRRRSRHPEVLMDDVAEEPARDDVAATALNRVEVGVVEAALAELPEAQRVAVVLSDVCGLTAREVAAAVGCPLGTALSRISRGRRAVARRVEGTAVQHEPRR